MSTWKEDLARQNCTDETKRKILEAAGNGDLDAMYECGIRFMQGKPPFQKDLQAGEEMLLQLSQINHNDYSDEIGVEYANNEQWKKAKDYLETAVRNGKREVVGILSVCCYCAATYEAAYQYAQMHMQMGIGWEGYYVMALMHDNGIYLQKSRSKAHDFYVLAYNNGCDFVKDRAVITYYGSAAQGRYLTKRLLIAVSVSLGFLLLAAALGGL